LFSMGIIACAVVVGNRGGVSSWRGAGWPTSASLSALPVMKRL